MWRPSVIDWWNNAWYWRDCVQHSSLIHSAWNSWAVQLCRQLRSIDVCQRVNVKSNVIFCLLWRERHRVGGGSATSSNLFSESALNSTARRAFWNIYADESSCRVGQLSTVGRAQSIRNAIPLDLQSLRGGSWSGRMRCMRHRVPFSCTKRLWSNTAHAAHIYCWSCCEHCSYTWWQYVHRFVA